MTQDPDMEGARIVCEHMWSACSVVQGVMDSRDAFDGLCGSATGSLTRGRGGPWAWGPRRPSRTRAALRPVRVPAQSSAVVQFLKCDKELPLLLASQFLKSDKELAKNAGCSSYKPVPKTRECTVRDTYTATEIGKGDITERRKQRPSRDTRVCSVQFCRARSEAHARRATARRPPRATIYNVHSNPLNRAPTVVAGPCTVAPERLLSVPASCRCARWSCASSPAPLTGTRAADR